MCTKSIRRTILAKKDGHRSDNSPWYGVVLEEKSNSMKDPDDPTKEIATFYPQKMLFINSKDIYESYAVGQEIQVAE